MDGLLVVSPYYNKATQNGLYYHYKTIADSVSLPMILYNVPSRTGTNIAPETVVGLCSDVENIVGVKEASGNISRVTKLMSLADGCVELYSGNDASGGSAACFGRAWRDFRAFNVAPRQTHDMCQIF